MPITYSTVLELQEQLLPIDRHYLFGAGISGANNFKLPISTLIRWGQQYTANGLINSRLKNLPTLIEKCIQRGLTAYIPSLLVLGDEIMYGAGASSQSNSCIYKLAEGLANYTGVGTATNWLPTNYSVTSGADLASVAAYLADDGDTGPSWNSNQRRLYKNGWISNRFNGIIMSAFRNSEDTMTLNQIKELFEMICLTVKRKNIDMICVFPPPKMDPIYGPADSLKWINMGIECKKIASKHSVTWIDAWSDGFLEWCRTGETESGINVPNIDDTSHQRIANLLIECITSSNVEVYTNWNTPTQYRTGRFVGRYMDTSATSTVNITGYTQNTSVRALSRSQSISAGVSVYSLNSGGSIFFTAPAYCRGAILSLITTPSISGYASVIYANQTEITGVYCNSQIVKEKHVYIPFNNTNNAIGSMGTLSVNAISGSVYTQGVTFISDDLTMFNVIPVDKTTTGVWQDTSFSSEQWTSCSTTGSYLSINWYGSNLAWFHIRGRGRGKYTVSHDNGSTLTFDAYNNSADTDSNQNTNPTLADSEFLNEGYHTSVFTVIDKNSSSSGSDVSLSRFRSYSRNLDRKSLKTPVRNTTTYDVLDYWENAFIDTAISGNPYIKGWLPGSTTLSVSGGDAIVCLTR